MSAISWQLNTNPHGQALAFGVRAALNCTVGRGGGRENAPPATLHLAAQCEAAGTDGEPQSPSAAAPTLQTAALSH